MDSAGRGCYRYREGARRVRGARRCSVTQARRGRARQGQQNLDTRTLHRQPPGQGVVAVWSRSSRWSLAVGTSLPPVSALHWPFSGKCYAKPTLVRWRFESIPDLELRRAPLSLALACAPFSSSNCCPPVDCLSSPPSPLPRPLCCARRHHGPPLDPGSCELPVPARGTPLHYAPQLRRHTSFAATSTPDGRQKHRHLRTPDPGSSTPTRACPR